MPDASTLLQLIGAQYVDILTLQRRLAALEKELADAKAVAPQPSPEK